MTSDRTIRLRVHEFLELSHPDDRWGVGFDYFMMVLIVLNVFAIIFETVSALDRLMGGFFFAFEVFSVAIFTVEYGLRVWSCTEDRINNYGHPIFGRLRFMVSPMAIIDFLAFAPFYLSAVFGVDLRILRIFRLLRLLKLTRYSPALLIIGAVMRSQQKALTAAVFIMLTALLFSSSIVFLFEREIQPEKFASIPQSMWWAIATLTTVGYGDVAPMTIGGKLFGALTMIMGIGMFALPTGVIATGFAQEIRKHEFIVTWRLVAKVPLFSDLDAAQVAEIVNLLTPLMVPSRHAVVRINEDADSMFFVISGELEAELSPQPVKLGAGDFFGEIGLLKKSTRTTDVVSVTECQLLELKGDDFWHLVDVHPDLGERVREVMEKRLADLEDAAGETV